MELENSQGNNDGSENEKGGDVYIHVDPGNVRRKLFQEETIESSESYPDFASVAKINDQGSQMASRNWSNRERQVGSHKDLKCAGKEKPQEIIFLLISHCKNLDLTNQIKERARIMFESVEIFHCYPECALRLCCAHTYSLIFLDLNGDSMETLLQLASNIRVSTFSNQGTAIVALKHIGTIKEEFWRKFGISDIIYGPLYHTLIDKLIEKWVGLRVKREQNSYDTTDNVASAMLKNEEEKEAEFQKQSSELPFPRQGWSNRNCSPAPACDSTDQIATYNASECPISNTALPIQDSASYFSEQTTNPGSTAYVVNGSSSVTTYSNGCFSSLSHPSTARPVQNDPPSDVTGIARPNNLLQNDNNNGKANSGWNMIQQILDLHQTGLKGIDIKPKNIANDSVSTTKTAACQPMATVYQPANQPSLKSYSGHSMFTAPVIPPNTAYMINGTPGTSNMRISLIPDEYTKHSNKERERRERIKESCDELRKILPKQLVAGRRQDMATVLEMTVLYLKAVQSHLPTVIQQQLFQSFLSMHDAPARKKRKSAETTPVSSYLIAHKHQRIQSSTLMHGCSLGPYTGPTYLPQILPGNSQQPTTLGYFPSIYHPIISNSYFGTLTPAPSPAPFGSGISQMAHMPLPQIDHDMHARSQFYNEASSAASGIPYYLSASSATRDANSNGVQKEVTHQCHF